MHFLKDDAAIKTQNLHVNILLLGSRIAESTLDYCLQI